MAKIVELWQIEVIDGIQNGQTVEVESGGQLDQFVDVLIRGHDIDPHPTLINDPGRELRFQRDCPVRKRAHYPDIHATIIAAEAHSTNDLSRFGGRNPAPDG